MNTTPFATIYNRFLDKITDDMYMELSPEDTIRDLQRLLVNAVPYFEFPRHNFYNYTINTQIINEEDVQQGDFVLGVIWDDTLDEGMESARVMVEYSCFNFELTEEEINILALLMMDGWLQRQIASIENIRMKYSGSDFKFTSQANHLAKLLSLQEKTWQQSFHMQRLYKRRVVNKNGEYRSNWAIFRNVDRSETDE